METQYSAIFVCIALQSKLYGRDINTVLPFPGEARRPRLAIPSQRSQSANRSWRVRSVCPGASHFGTSECAQSSSAANSDWIVLTRGMARESVAFKACHNNSIPGGVTIRGVIVDCETVC